MSKRSSIIANLIAHIEDSVGYGGFRGLRFLHEINSFPAFYVHPGNENRQHLGDGRKLAVLSLDIRGYGWSEGLGYIETLVRELESAVESFRDAYPHLVQESRVTQLRTDEGAMEPYCICDMSVEILYSVERVQSITCDNTWFTCDSTVLTVDRGYSI